MYNRTQEVRDMIRFFIGVRVAFLVGMILACVAGSSFHTNEMLLTVAVVLMLTSMLSAIGGAFVATVILFVRRC